MIDHISTSNLPVRHALIQAVVFAYNGFVHWQHANMQSRRVFEIIDRYLGKKARTVSVWSCVIWL